MPSHMQPGSRTKAAPQDGHPLERPAEAQPEHVVAVIIPAYNEERFIASVVLKTRTVTTQVIVVDDGSTDRTAELAEATGAVVLRLSENRGKAAALTAGFTHALTLAPDAIVCLDADAQHEPAEIPYLAKPILDDLADVVVGSRFLSMQSAIPRWRRFGQHTLTAMTNIMSGTRITDSQSGFRAFSVAAVRALNLASNGLSVESEMQFQFANAGLRVVEVPISVRYLDGNKRNPIVHGLQIVDTLVSLVARRRPLLFFSLPGVLLTSAGSLLGLHVALVMKIDGTLLTGSAMVTVLLLVIGLLLAVTGIILHSMGHLVERLREVIQLNTGGIGRRRGEA
jgi:glycosyltransferase involved in cell wall biosynthesis